MQQPQQPYDSSLKSFLEGLAAQVIPELVFGAELEEELNDEMLKPPLRADRVYRVQYRSQSCILHIELETGDKSNIVYRMLEYYGILFRKHRKPVISVVIYPFRMRVPESPLRIAVDEEEILTLHFHVIALWKLQAQSYLRRRMVSMYALLPTMEGATYNVLKQAVDEMKQVYAGDRRRLGEQILLFETLLQRTDMVSDEDKHKMEEYLDMFENLLEESRFVKKKWAEGKAEGKVEGKAEGTIEALRQVVVEFVQTRFPSQTELAQQKVAMISEPQQLHLLIVQLAVANDEKTTRELLNTLRA